jgi:predicted SprT family Zn-dependent metalloprotease
MYVIHRLVFNGQLVGYRVLVNGNKYDVALDDMDLFEHDFSVKPYMVLKEPDIILEEQGTQLLPKNAPNVLELTYGRYATLKGYEFMSKTDSDLKRLYNEYNKKCFDNKLSKHVAVEWSTRMTSGAGICIGERDKVTGNMNTTIRLSVPYHERYTDEVLDTLVHEMIHVLLPYEHHGRKFHAVKDDLNARFGFTLAVKATGVASYKYKYICEGCGIEYDRSKKLNVKTARCGKRSCSQRLYLAEDLTDDAFDDVDWGAGTDW